MSIFFKPPYPVLSQVEAAILEKLKHIARITAIFSQTPHAHEFEYLTSVSTHIKRIESNFYERAKETVTFSDIEASR